MPEGHNPRKPPKEEAQRVPRKDGSEDQYFVNAETVRQGIAAQNRKHEKERVHMQQQHAEEISKLRAAQPQSRRKFLYRLGDAGLGAFIGYELSRIFGVGKKKAIKEADKRTRAENVTTHNQGIIDAFQANQPVFEKLVTMPGEHGGVIYFDGREGKIKIRFAEEMGIKSDLNLLLSQINSGDLRQVDLNLYSMFGGAFEKHAVSNGHDAKKVHDYIEKFKLRIYMAQNAKEKPLLSDAEKKEYSSVLHYIEYLRDVSFPISGLNEAAAEINQHTDATAIGILRIHPYGTGQTKADAETTIEGFPIFVVSKEPNSQNIRLTGIFSSSTPQHPFPSVTLEK